MDMKEFLDPIIAHMERTTEESWCEGVVRRSDTGQNCFFGHLHSMAPDDKAATRLWDQFEASVATEFMVYPVNDGIDPRYPQATPRQRVLAYLADIRDGRAKSTSQCMEEDFLAQTNG